MLQSATAYDLLNWEDRAQGIETLAPNWFDLSLLVFVVTRMSKGTAGDDSITRKNGYSSLLPVLTVNHHCLYVYIIQLVETQNHEKDYRVRISLLHFYSKVLILQLHQL